MTQNNKMANTATINTFAEAFIKLMKCTRNEIKAETLIKGEEALIHYNNQTFKVSSREALSSHINFQLSDEEAARTFDVSIWIEATKNTATIGRFLSKVALRLETAGQARLLNLALSINSFSEDQYETFWYTLANIDDTGDLISNAMISAREVYNGDGLLEDLTDLMILDGKNQYNMIPDGIFETVCLSYENGDGFTFFIYSIANEAENIIE